MSSEPRAASSRERVRAHRARLREQGLRPIQIWVPDVATPEFAAEARRQAQAVASSSEEVEDLAFMDSLFDDLPWEDALESDEDQNER